MQGFEYSEAGFTIADSVYGSCFFAATGLHGLTIAPTKNFTFLFNKFFYLNITRSIWNSILISENNEKSILKNDKLYIDLDIKNKKRKIFYLERYFLEWLAGFTDAEGNFNISLRNFKNNTYNSYIITYQINLHIDDLNVLNFIKDKLKCGHISISGNRCNYFVNDKNSLIFIILPIFKFVQLHSSKYLQFKIFEKALILIKNKEHLNPEGKLKLINYFYEMKKDSLSLMKNQIYH